VGLTAAGVYGLDLERLRPLANRIGPTVGELSVKPSVVPGPDYFGFGFRESSLWPASAAQQDSAPRTMKQKETA
jgi:hypothetical protein